MRRSFGALFYCLDFGGHRRFMKTSKRALPKSEKVRVAKSFGAQACAPTPPSAADTRSPVLFDSGHEIAVQAGDDGIRFLLVEGQRQILQRLRAARGADRRRWVVASCDTAGRGRKSLAGVVRSGRRSRGPGRRERHPLPVGVRAAPPGARGVVWPDRHEHAGGTPSGIQRARKRHVSEVNRL